MDEASEPLVGTKPVHWRRRLLIIVVALLVVGLSVSTGIALHNRKLSQKDLALANRASAQAAHWKSESQRLQQSLQELQAKIAKSVGDLDNPRFVLWNACGSSHGCPIGPSPAQGGSFYVGGVPDTFEYHVGYRATVPVSVLVIPTSDYACWYAQSCLYGRNFWGHGPTNRLDDAVFRKAEGCADYLAMFWSNRAGTFYPHVSVVRHPATEPTGVCG
jgi:hypothetical protein